MNIKVLKGIGALILLLSIGIAATAQKKNRPLETVLPALSVEYHKDDVVSIMDDGDDHTGLIVTVSFPKHPANCSRFTVRLSMMIEKNPLLPIYPVEGNTKPIMWTNLRPLEFEVNDNHDFAIGFDENNPYKKSTYASRERTNWESFKWFIPWESYYDPMNKIWGQAQQSFIIAIYFKADVYIGGIRQGTNHKIPIWYFTPPEETEHSVIEELDSGDLTPLFDKETPEHGKQYISYYFAVEGQLPIGEGWPIKIIYPPGPKPTPPGGGENGGEENKKNNDRENDDDDDDDKQQPHKHEFVTSVTFDEPKIVKVSSEKKLDYPEFVEIINGIDTITFAKAKSESGDNVYLGVLKDGSSKFATKDEAELFMVYLNDSLQKIEEHKIIRFPTVKEVYDYLHPDSNTPEEDFEDFFTPELENTIFALEYNEDRTGKAIEYVVVRVTTEKKCSCGIGYKYTRTRRFSNMNLCKRYINKRLNQTTKQTKKKKSRKKG